MSRHTVGLALALLPLVGMYANRGVVPLLLLLGIVLLADRVVRKDRSPPPGRPVLIALAGVILWGGLSELWAETPSLALVKAGALAGLAVAGILIVSAAARDGVSVTLPLAGLAVAAAMALIEQASGMAPSRFLFEVIEGTVPGPSSVIPTRFKTGASLAVLIGLPLFFHLFALGRRGLSLVALSAPLVLIGVSSSNSAAIGFAAALGLGLLARLEPRLAGLALATAALAAFLLAGLAGRMPDSRDLAEAFPHLPNSALHRSAIWHFAADKAMERPLLGWGLEASRSLPGGEDTIGVWIRHTESDDSLYVMEVQALPLHPHNFAVQVWLETGVIGVALFASLLLLLARAIARMVRENAAIAAAALGGALPIAAVTVGLWQSWWVSSLWLIAGLVVGLVAPRHRAGQGNVATQ